MARVFTGVVLRVLELIQGRFPGAMEERSTSPLPNVLSIERE